MNQLLLTVAYFMAVAALSQAAPPKPSDTDQIVGNWEPLPQAKAPENRFPCEFFGDGKITAGSGKAQQVGTYKLVKGNASLTLTISWERDGKPLPPETAIICFLGDDQLVWYPEGEWKGIALKRKQKPH